MKSAAIKALWIVAGIVLFMVLSLIDSDPLFGSAALNPGFIVLTLAACLLGPAAGCVVGGAGMAMSFLLYFHFSMEVMGRMLNYSLPQILGAAAAGLLLGGLLTLTGQWENTVSRFLLSIAAAIVAAAVGLLLVPALVQSQMMGYSFAMAIRRNTNSFIANGAMMLLGVPLAMWIQAALQKRPPDDLGGQDREQE